MTLRLRRLFFYLASFAGLIAVLSLAPSQAVDAHEMNGHMTMTALRPMQPGDKERAAAIVAGARMFAERYTDYHKALADGYTIFHPELPQHVYHFTQHATAVENTIHFDAARPTSLLYEKLPGKEVESEGSEPNFKLVGVMYTAPYQATEAQLDQRAPLSIAQWHLHTNLCLPPAGQKFDMEGKDAKFGLQGSITTAAACQAAGGRFMPHFLGWMLHVYPFETDPKKIWSAGMDDEHGMEHDAMPMSMPGMKM